MGDSERKARAEERRRTTTVKVVSLSEQKIDPFPVSGVEGISLAWQISKQAWSLSGKPWPAYDRANIPIRLVKRTD